MPYSAGSVVLRESPFAHVVNRERLELVCDSCLAQSTSLKRCATCRLIRYCGVKCQRRAWSRHREECANFLCKFKGNTANLPSDTTRLLLRVLLRLRRGDEGDTVMPDGSSRSFRALKTHAEEIRGNEAMVAVFIRCLNFLLCHFERIEAAERALLFDVFCVLRINCFDVFNADNESVGSAVYVAASKLDHACWANAERSFQGADIVIRATQNIQSFDQVRVVYTNPLAPTKVRRAELRQQYFFDCHCEACIKMSNDPQYVGIDALKEDGLKCPSCSREVVLMQNSQCEHCNAAFKEDFVRETKLLRSKMSEIEPNDEPSEELVVRISDKLSIYDLDVVAFVRNHLSSIANSREMYKLALKSLEAQRKMVSSTDPLLASFLRHLGQSEVESGRLDSGMRHLKEALNIYTLCYGQEHQQTKDIVFMLQTLVQRSY